MKKESFINLKKHEKCRGTYIVVGHATRLETGR